MMDYKQIAQNIYNVIVPCGIEDFAQCMTRLRVKTSNPSNIDISQLKKIESVLGVVNSGDEIQIILGPGTVSKVFNEFNTIVNNNYKNLQTEKKDSILINSVQTNINTTVNTNKEKNKSTLQSNIVARTLSKFAKIFTPLIPAFIAAGFLSAIAGIVQVSVDNDWSNNVVAYQWYYVFSVALQIWQTGFLIIVGWRFCELFGGKGWIGAIFGALYTPLSGLAFQGMWTPDISNPESGLFLGIPIEHVRINWLTSGLATYDTNNSTWTLGTPHGSIFGIIVTCVVGIRIEKIFNNKMPTIFNTYLTPLLTTVILLFGSIFLFIPVSGYLFFAMSWMFGTLTNGPGAPFGDALLAALFIFAVLFGIHQGFIPIYIALMNTPPHINTLFPILTLGGATQVGGAICLYLLGKKNGTLRKQVVGPIITGFLGIGEPILYGISLPRIVPLVASAIAATIPGFLAGAINTWGGINMGLNAAFGPPGVMAIIMITSTNGLGTGITIYVITLGVAYISGFFATLLGYRIFKNSSKIQWNLE